MANLIISPPLTKIPNLAFFFFFLLLGSSDSTLIADTCKQTPNYNLCVSSIAADPRGSKAADVETLALVMIDAVNSKATAASQRINHLMKTAPPSMRKPLRACAQIYDIITKYEIPEAIQAVRLGDPKFGEDAMNDSAAEPASCEQEFGGSNKSPLSQHNQAVHGVAVVTAAIIRLLL
ncbi:Cell wall / vacuolar inhibitor of fructosidase 1 [Linum perenne]